MNILQHLLALPQQDKWTVTDHKGDKHTTRASNSDEAIYNVSHSEHTHVRHLKATKVAK